MYRSCMAASDASDIPIICVAGLMPLKWFVSAENRRDVITIVKHRGRCY
jgi:hypothetical protein